MKRAFLYDRRLEAQNLCFYYSVCAPEHCQPVSVVKSLLPRWNSLVFFEVSPVSFHQVVTSTGFPVISD